MSKVTVRQLEAFRAVMLTGSMTGAAELLHMTQPAVSRLIRDLESASSLQLFERHANHLIPTRDAMNISEEVDRSFAGLARVSEYIHSVRQQTEGSLKIGALSAFATGLLPRYAASFLKTKPAIRLSLNAFTSPEVFERVASGELDFGYVMNAAERPGFYVRKMYADALIALRFDHPLANKNEVTPVDLSGHTLIGSYKSLLQARIDLAIAGIDGIRRIETSYSRIACALAAEGAGVAFVDPFSVQEFASGGLITKKFKPEIECDFALIVAQKRLPTPLAENFIAGFQSHLAKLVADPSSEPA